MRARPSTLAFLAILTIMVGSLVWLLVESFQPGPVVLAEDVLQRPATPRRASTTLTTRVSAPAEPAPNSHIPLQAKPPLLPTVRALGQPDSLPNEALLVFRSPEALAAFRARAASLGLEVLAWDPKLGAARVRFQNLGGLERDLAEHGADYAEVGPNYVVRVPGLPPAASSATTDTANAGGREPFRSQGLEAIGAAADRSGWGKGVTVAVIDSGIAPHPSLQNADITHVDMVNDGSTLNGHGTAMASLIAGSDAAVGGVSPAAKLLDIRVADTQGNSNTAVLSSAIVKATDMGARVINISLGSSGTSAMLEQAVKYAQSHNVVIVAAAGNEQLSTLSMPAGLAGVVSVAAVDAAGTQAYFSNSGQGLVISAPGVGIVSGYSDSKLVIGSGTSQATAITSGVVAYLLGRGYYSQNIIPLLTRTAAPLNAPNTAVGAGLIQVVK